MSIKNRIRNISLPVIVWTLFGYFILHPVSILIFHVFEKRLFDFGEILRGAFALEHISMGIYFALIGSAIGIVFAVFYYRLWIINEAILKINQELRDQNQDLYGKIQARKKNSSALDALRTTLNKVNKGVDLISSGSIGEITRRQLALLDLTKENINNLFKLINHSLGLDPDGQERNKI